MNSSAIIYAGPEPKAREEYLSTRFSEIQAEAIRVRVKKLTLEARMISRGSKRATGRDLYTQEKRNLPARGQEVIGTGIAMSLPPNTYGGIA